jgi:OmpA-OmpF porin, OOP family
MRRWTLNLLSIAAVLAITVFGAPAIQATSDDERPGEIGILAGIGLGDESLVGADNDTNINPVFGGRFGWHFTNIIAGFADLTYTAYEGDPTLFGDSTEIALRLGPEWYVNPKSSWQFFLNFGIGAIKYDTDLAGSDSRGFGSAGLGVRRGWQPGAFRAELRADHDLSSATGLGDQKFTNFKLLVGWTWGIGTAPVDSDGDGVYDGKDKCPDTPSGAIVDKAGCPSDADGDGVFDGIDQCPDTPQGWPVNPQGCPLDSDGDGIPDGKDKCANTPKGCTVNADGCPADADADGVCDGVDQCANTPKGCRVDARGCPVDSDGDGVCDGVDQCAGTAKGLTVDARGCPPPPPPPPAFIPEPKKELVLERVFFETNSSKLKPESAGTLDKVAESLKNFPDVKIQVAGHTDNTGSAKYNLKLSEARAKSVKDYLVSKGVSPDQLTAKGYGLTEPVADNKTAEGRAQNRRVGLRRVE